MSQYSWVIPSPSSLPATGGATSTTTQSAAIRGRATRALDLVIDPLTKDFVDTADGGWLESDDSRTAVICQMESLFNRWWGDPSSGSLLREIMASELPRATELRDETLRCLQALVDESVIIDLQVAIETNATYGLAALIISYTDQQSGRPADLAYVPITR